MNLYEYPVIQESYNTPLEHTRSAIPVSPTMKGIPL